MEQFHANAEEDIAEAMQMPEEYMPRKRHVYGMEFQCAAKSVEFKGK